MIKMCKHYINLIIEATFNSIIYFFRMQFLQRNSMEQNNTTIQIGIGQQFNNQFVQNQQSSNITF